MKNSEDKLKKLCQLIDETLVDAPSILWTSDFNGCGFRGVLSQKYTPVCSTLEELVVELEKLFKNRLLEKIEDEKEIVAEMQSALDEAKGKVKILEELINELICS